MEQKVKNQIADNAKTNKKIVMKFEKELEASGGIIKGAEQIISLAYENENNIEYTAELLERDLLRGIEKFKETIHYLKTNRSGCLSSSGVLQNLNHDIDTNVVLLQQLEKNRQYYRPYIK